MTDKQLTNKAIDIKWKKYVLVSDRIIYFNETYPNGSITTERLSEWDMEIVKATVIPDVSNPDRKFTWYSQAKRWDGFINKTSALENAETSATWRALAFLWIGVIDSIASVDEINKAENTEKASKKGFSKESVFQRAYNNVEFMQNCLDEDNFIKQVKEHMELDEIQEWQLRRRYQEVNKPENTDLPFS